MNMEQNNDLYPNPEQKKESEMWKGASWNSFFLSSEQGGLHQSNAVIEGKKTTHSVT